MQGQLNLNTVTLSHSQTSGHRLQDSSDFHESVWARPGCWIKILALYVSADYRYISFARLMRQLMLMMLMMTKKPLFKTKFRKLETTECLGQDAGTFSGRAKANLYCGSERHTD